MLKVNNKKLRGFLLLALGLATGVWAQIILIDSRVGDFSTYFSIRQWPASVLTNTSPVAGVGIYMLAGIFFVLGLRSFAPVFPALPIYQGIAPINAPKIGFWLTSLTISIVLAKYASLTKTSNPIDYIFAALWVLSIALLVVSVLVGTNWRPPSKEAIWEWWKAHRTELIVIGALGLMAFVIRCLDVEFHPYSFINDEGQMGNGGECILDLTCANFFSVGWADQARAAYFPYAISIAWFGKTAFAVRLVSVLHGTLSVVAVYLLAREIFDQKVAWLSAVILAILPVHIHFSRTGVDNIIDSVTATLILLLLFRGIKYGSKLSFLLAGVITGLCFYTYPGSLLAAMLGVGLLILVAIRIPSFIRTHLSDMVVFILAVVVVVVPLLGYYSSHSQYFLSRLKRESIVQQAGIPAQSKATGLNAAEILTVQFAKSTLVFITSGAPGNFFNSPEPYLPAVEAIVFVMALVVVLWRSKDLRYFVIFVWFWAVVILGSTLTGGAPTSQRLLMSTPAMAIIVALGMIDILAAFKQFYQPVAKIASFALLGLMLYFGYASLSYYFFDYRVGHYYEDPTNELTYETGAFIAPLHDQGVMILVAEPNNPYLMFGSFHYFSPDVKTYDFNVMGKNMEKLPRDKDILFLALPAYKMKLELIANLLPGGKWTTFPRRYQPKQVLFYSYKITKEQLAAAPP